MKVILPVNVEVKKEEIMLHEDFIRQRIKDSEKLYKRRGMFRPSDIINGLIGEIAAWKILSQQYDMKMPDTTIHEVRNKNHGADLNSTDGKKFHLKCQDTKSMDLYGAAWVFEKSNVIFRGGKADEYAVFCTSTIDRNINIDNIPDVVMVTIRSIVKFGDLKSLLQDEEKLQMDVPYMRKYKNVIKLKFIPKEFK